jgi:hypothetical protein
MTPNTNDTHTHEETGSWYPPFAICFNPFEISFVPKHAVSHAKETFGNNPTGLKFVSYQFWVGNTVVLG